MADRTPDQILLEFLAAHDERCESELIEYVGYTPCDCDRRRLDDLDDFLRGGVVALSVAPSGFPWVPEGSEVCRVSVDGRQVTHLVALDRTGSNGGRPTMCGLTRFDVGERRADLPSWGMGGGITGPGVIQYICPTCYRRASR